MKERIKWIDVAKFWGIFAIYLGHYREAVGYAYAYVFSFHVPLFFLISGCMESRNTKSVAQDIYRKFTNILIPFFVFGIFSIIICVIQDNAGVGMAGALVKVLLKGAVRNQFFAPGLWFLPCLFVIGVMFTFIKRLKYKPVILAVCAVCYLVAQMVIEPRPITDPHWLYNIDSAFYYIIFYGIGYAGYEWIDKILNSKRKLCRILVFATGGAALIYSALLYFEMDLLWKLGTAKYADLLYDILCPIITIWVVFLFSWLCRNISLFQNIGKNTLYLCGSEWLVKTLFPLVLTLLGWNMGLVNPLSAYICTFLLLCLTTRFLVPAEKRILDAVKEAVKNLFHAEKLQA